MPRRTRRQMHQGVLGSRARHGLPIADGQRPEQQQALIVLGQVAHKVSQQLESLGMFFQSLGRGGRDGALSTEQSRVGEDIG